MPTSTLCVFSMVVPLQMRMFTLSRTTDTPGFSTPLEIEEAGTVKG